MAKTSKPKSANAARQRDIHLPSSLKERLAQGHPWVYRNHLPPDLRMPTGSWVRAHCGNWSGFGLWDEHGPIALRIFSERRLPDAAWLRTRVQAAWDLRAPLRATNTTAYRLLFGEGDGLPGLTVDLYGEWAVIQTYAASVEHLIDWLVPALHDIVPLKGILHKRRAADSDPTELREEDTEEGRISSRLVLLWGAPPPRNLVISEYGLLFNVDLNAGQKTGLFLDQRENRRYVEGLSAGRTLLNCFSYTGAFSLYALRGGAKSVVSVDIGKGLAEAAEANIALNNLDAKRHQFVTADCFEVLSRYLEEGRRFDIIILDPPSFAKSQRNRFAAIRAYTKLNAVALRCVSPGGLLISSSCTSQVGPEAFKEMLAAAGASVNKRFQIIHEAGQPLDHPVPAGFPEGRYLKFVVGRVSDRP